MTPMTDPCEFTAANQVCGRLDTAVVNGVTLCRVHRPDFVMPPQNINPEEWN